MSKPRVFEIKSYIESLNQCINEDLHINHSIYVDKITKVVKTLEYDYPNIGKGILFDSSSFNKDCEKLVSRLKLILRDLESEDTNNEDSYSRFWKSFIAWFESDGYVEYGLKDKYKNYDNWNGGFYYANIDYSNEFEIEYGITKSYDEMKNDHSIKMIYYFIELAYEKWVNDRYDFTVNVNKKFEQFQIPQKLIKGKLTRTGTINRYNTGPIIDKEMFENKLDYSKRIINGSNLMDKKTALDIVIDCLQYLVSIQSSSGVKNKYKDIGLKIGQTNKSKVYTVINTELNEIMKLSNEYFDIRHNEIINKSDELREPLTNKYFIEYLYNRCHSLVNLIKLYE